MFEPTDLEMEETGIAELDLQVGAIRGPRPDPWRAVLPDFEIDVGILPNVELDLDGAYAIEGPATGPFSFDHAAPDSLWPSLKLGLLDFLDTTKDHSGAAFALGFQLGPKLPVAAQAHGLGFESLALLGYGTQRVHTALNLGGFVETAPDASSSRPKGLEGGLDLGVDLGADGRFSVTGEVSAVRFFSSDPRQLLATGGMTWSATPEFDLSLVGLVGLVNGSDRFGALLGISPKMHLFGKPKAL